MMFKIFVFFLLLSNQVFAKDLIIKDQGAVVFDLNDTKGKVVIVNFWVSWCVNCKKEMEILTDLYNKYHSLGLEVIGFSIDEKRNRDDFLKVKKDLKYPNFMLEDAVKNDFGWPNMIPKSYLIDRKGNVVLLEDIEDVEGKIRGIIF